MKMWQKITIIVGVLVVLAASGIGGYLYVNYVYGQGYHNGYADGHTKGYSQGKAAGYTSGYQDGTSNGYTSGWNDGEIRGLINGQNSYVSSSCMKYPFLLLDSNQYWACRIPAE